MTRIEELVSKAQSGDMDAKDALVEENAGLVWSIVRRFQGRGVEMEDLFQLGCVGFIKAIEGFDTQFGTQFSTYAVPKISGEIRRFLRDDGSIKVSRTVKENAFTIHAAKEHLTKELGREPTVNEISGRTGLAIEDIAMAEMATATVESIQKDTGEEGFSLENLLSDTESEEQMVEKLAVRQAVDSLQEKEKRIIYLRYFHGLTQQKTAAILDISQVQVSRLERKAIEHLRMAMG